MTPVAAFDDGLMEDDRVAAVAWIDAHVQPRDVSWSTSETVLAELPASVRNILQWCRRRVEDAYGVESTHGKPVRAVGIRVDNGQSIRAHYDESYVMTVFYYLSEGAPLIVGEPNAEISHAIAPGFALLCPGGVRHRVPTQDAAGPRYSIVTVW